MIEELDLLKKDWKKSENSFQQITETDIYKMIHKKSSSIVKWILIISILEFLVLRGMDFLILFDKDYTRRMEKIHLYNFEIVLTVVNYVVLIVFIYLFYINFRRINASSSTKKLMDDILNTRKIVKYYVWYNLFLVGISSAIAVFSEISYNDQLSSMYDKNKMILCCLGLGIVLVLFVIFWLFYRLLYGILLRRLHKNYTELEKIDL